MTAARGVAWPRAATARAGSHPVDRRDAARRPRARPDPGGRARSDAPGGWRVGPDVKAAILARFARPDDRDWSVGPFTFRDRAAVPPRDRQRVARGGRPGWDGHPARRPPRPGRRRDAAVVRQRRRLGRRGLDGRFARARRLVRADRGAGPSRGRRHDRRRPRAARGAPGDRRGRCLRGAGSPCSTVSSSGAARSSRPGSRSPARPGSTTSSARRVIEGTADAPLVVPAGAVVVPGARSVDGRSRTRTGCRCRSRAGQGPRRRHVRAGRPRRGAAMTVEPRSDRVAAGPAPQRDPPVRAARRRGAGDACRAVRDAAYVYDFDVIERQARASRGAAARRRDRVRGQGQPVAGRRDPSRPPWSRRRRRVGRRARPAAGAGIAGGPDRHDRARASATTNSGRLSASDPRGDRRVAGRAGRLERDRRGRPAGVQPVLLRAAVTEGARLERVRLVGDDGAGKFGMDAADLVEAARLAARSAAPRAARAPRLWRVERARRERARRPRRRDGARRPRVARLGGRRAPARRRRGRPRDPIRAHEERWTWPGWVTGSPHHRRRPTDPLLAGERLLLEPGRFLVGPAGVYVTRWST